ncbi:MAG TPA: glycosyltransferase family 39 protein [Vicinamibacterales bacterium]|nr:glycosyltransferase family 39 protein [Vicinamibacterales bacterium]
MGVASIAALLYLAPLLLNAPLTDPDEGLHAAISQEMVERGDFVVPRFLGRAFLDKPVLFFWAQAASMRAFGMTATAARLPGMLFALLGIVTTGWLAGVLFSGQQAAGSGQWAAGSWQQELGGDARAPRNTQHETASCQLPAASWVAAGCYATMVLPFLLAQAPVHDIALVPFTNLALGFLWRGGRDPGSGIRDPLMAGVVLGVSILAKGLEGVAIVGTGYVLYLLITRSLTRRLVAHGVLVVAVAALAALPWYLAMNAREPGYLRYYFVDRHLLGFATDTQRHSGQPWWFYLPVVIGGGLPWILFTRGTTLRGLSRRRSAPELLLWTWLIGAVALLSLSQSKAITYVLPAMPAIAVMAAASHRSMRTWRLASLATAAIYAIALFAFGPAVARSHSARELAGYFNEAGSVPATVFVFDQRVSFVYDLRPDLRRQLYGDRVRSVSVEELAAMQPFPRDAVVTVPIDLAAPRLPRIPGLANAQRHVAGRYLVVVP